MKRKVFAGSAVAAALLFQLTAVSFPAYAAEYDAVQKEEFVSSFSDAETKQVAQYLVDNGLSLEESKDLMKTYEKGLAIIARESEIIARVVHKWGFNTIRGSKDNQGERRKGGMQATLQMIERLKEGQNVAIMVDGPAGPFHEVKNGVIKVAKKTGAAIIPMTWYSPNKTMLNLPTWDKFQIPMGFTKIVNLYGEPIYISEDADVEEDIRVKQQLKEALLDLDRKAPEAFKEAYKKQK